MNLPPKPESVSHVTDAHWKAALDLAASVFDERHRYEKMVLLRSFVQ
jgi:hypothetical protein